MEIRTRLSRIAMLGKKKKSKEGLQIESPVAYTNTECFLFLCAHIYLSEKKKKKRQFGLLI